MDAQALGRYLRQSREAKELTFEDAERALFIRRRVLESFELGDFNIPDMSVVQIRGFIRNYARFLGLDEDRVVQHYDASRLTDGVGLPPGNGPKPGGKYGNRQKQNKKRKTSETKRTTGSQSVVPTTPRSITDTDPTLPPVPVTLTEQRRSGGGVFSVLLRLLVALAAVAVIVFVAVQLVQDTSVLPPQAGGPNSDILADLPPSPTRTPPPTSTPALAVSPLPGITGLQPSFSGDGVLVTMTATQRTFLRIVTDGVEQFADIAPPGTTIEIPARESILITASNAAALEVVWNGQPQGAFGMRGQQVDITFTPGGVQVSSGPAYEPTSPFTPTPLPTSAVDVQAAIAEMTPSDTPGPSPTPTLTPTETLTPTITPTPTETLTPTLTLTPSDTPTITLTPSDTPTITPSPTVTLTPSPTRTPTITPSPTITMTPSPTAILPLRMTPANPTATKAGA